MAAKSYDVIVIGLGGMGSGAACHLASRGKRVLGLEQFTPAHDRGSSHGESRIIRQAYHENPAYVPLVQRAFKLWEELERDTGLKMLSLTGGLMIGPSDSGVVRGTIRSAIEHELRYEVFEADELRRRYPVFRPRPDDVAVFETKAGFLRPEIAVRAHLQLATQHGADLQFGETIQSWKSNAATDSVEVVTDLGTYSASRLIIAAGAWAQRLIPDLPVTFNIRRHTMCWFAPQDGIDNYLPTRMPIYIWEVNEQEAFYGFPATDGQAGGVKAAMHSGGDPCTPETLVTNSISPEINELRGNLAQFIPGLNARIIKSAPCMYTLTPDEHFIVSTHPDIPQVAIAAGFSGHGFKFASVIGEVLADLATDGQTKHSINFLSPKRFGAKAATR